MSQKKSTIGISPLDSVIPQKESITPAKQSSDELKECKVYSTNPTTFNDEKSVKNKKKERLTFNLSLELSEKIRNAVYWEPDLTLSSLAEQAMTNIIQDLEKKHGGSFPERKGSLKLGRPMA